jgi:hypothetical protein
MMTDAGYTTADIARRYRVGEDKVRAWIKTGELVAVNTSATICGKPRYVVTPDSLATFEQKRATNPPPKPKRKQRRTQAIDFYPD